jgi:hypothetical protein
LALNNNYSYFPSIQVSGTDSYGPTLNVSHCVSMCAIRDVLWMKEGASIDVSNAT